MQAAPRRRRWIRISSVSACFGLLAAATTVSMDGSWPSPPEARAGERTARTLPSSAVLALLPAGEEKRRFLLDCTGCHQMEVERTFPGGQGRTRAEWEAIVRRMLGYAGATSSFPVISAGRDPEATAEFLARHFAGPPTAYPYPAPARRARVTEFAYPHDTDLPHDLIVDAEGKVVITGMFSGRMLRLDPETGRYDQVSIPGENANPRALEIDAEGNWWVLLGKPKKIARYRPATGAWRSWDIGLYGHSVRVDPAGRAWFNGHFTNAPPLIGYVDPDTDEVRTFAVPATPPPETANPIPYGLRIAPDGSVWGTELQGNRVYRFDPEAERFRVWRMPRPQSGPRRPDFDGEGNFWIPEYADNRIARLDPRTGEFHEVELPIADALPYIVRVDRARGRVWIATAAADAVLAFDPGTERFDVHPLPTRGALVRHMDVAPRTGDLWVAYGASPGIPPKIARLRVTDR